MTEVQLIEKATNGDKKAFTQLVLKYNERIYNLALRLLRNKEDAEDILQETFITVLEKLHTFDGKSGFFTWLYRIATNACLMKLRKKRPEVSNLPDNLSEYDNYESKIFVDWSQNPLADIQNKEMKDAIDKAMEKLSDIYRTVFVLRDIENMSIKETSDIIGITEENVKIRLKRARMFLRDELSKFFSESIVQNEIRRS